MASNRQPYWRTLGTPTHFVLYRTPDQWRYAVYLTGPAGIADGALVDPPSSSKPDIAQTALLQKAEKLTRRRLEVLWHASGQPDCWTGTVADAGPLPPA